MKKKSTTKKFVVQILLTSRTGKRPDVRTLCGDTIFCRMDEGMTATWTLKRRKPKERIA